MAFTSYAAGSTATSPAQRTKVYHGALCKRGHGTERFTSSKTCVECSRLQQAARLKENREEINAKRKLRRAKDPDKLREENRRWRQRNREELNAKRRARFKNDVEWRERQRKQAAEHRAKPGFAEAARKYHRRWRYGLSDEQFEAMNNAQGGLCAICHRLVDLKVDHCHVTGRVRGLLCRECNLGIGVLGESEDRFLGAIAYLRAHKCP